MTSNLFDRHIVLENDIVRLEPFSERFIGELSEIIHDREITQFSGAHIVTEQDLIHYVRRTMEVREQRMGYPFIVIDRASGKAAGATRFGNIQMHARRLEIGWTWYGREFRGSGINLACKHALLSHAFEELKCNRVQFSVDIDNWRSRRAVEKLGATQEGIFRSNYVNASGESRDDVYFSIIRSEWDEIEQRVFPMYCKR